MPCAILIPHSEPFVLPPCLLCTWPTFYFFRLSSDSILIDIFCFVPPEKLIVCITQTGPSLPYHCYWGEKIQMHKLSPSHLSSSPLPSSPLFIGLSPPRWDKMRVGIQRKWLCCRQNVSCNTHAYRYIHTIFTNSFNCSNWNRKYIQFFFFLNYNSSVKAITFVDNHFILVLSSCLLYIFLAIVNILVNSVTVDMLLPTPAS